MIDKRVLETPPCKLSPLRHMIRDTGVLARDSRRGSYGPSLRRGYARHVTVTTPRHKTGVTPAGFCTEVRRSGRSIKPQPHVTYSSRRRRAVLVIGAVVACRVVMSAALAMDVASPVLFMIRGEIMINDYDSFLFGAIII